MPRRRRTIARHYRLRPIGQKLGGGFEDTRFDSIASARARERRCGEREIAEHRHRGRNFG